jgi:hypothetical protein
MGKPVRMRQSPQLAVGGAKLREIRKSRAVEFGCGREASATGVTNQPR